MIHRRQVSSLWRLAPVALAATLCAAAATEAAAAKAKSKAAGKDPLHPCDALAGHPGDPGHQGDGVNDADVVPAEAIQQCTLAVKQQPRNARFHFQLGRAYWLGKQYDNAVASLLVAEEMKYAAAHHYLGLAYEQGRIKGEPPDKAFAADLFKMAVAGGFDADAVKLDSRSVATAPAVQKAEDLDASQLKEPGWVRALFSGDMNALNGSRRQVLTYASGIQSFISLDPNEYDPTCLKLYDPSLDEKIGYEQTGVGYMKTDLNKALSEARRMMAMAAQHPGMLSIEAQRNEQLTQNGVDDINVLSVDYGSCAGPVVQRVYNNLRRFVREKPQPKQPGREGTSPLH